MGFKKWHRVGGGWVLSSGSTWTCRLQIPACLVASSPCRSRVSGLGEARSFPRCIVGSVVRRALRWLLPLSGRTHERMFSSVQSLWGAMTVGLLLFPFRQGTQCPGRLTYCSLASSYEDRLGGLYSTLRSKHFELTSASSCLGGLRTRQAG